jgi:hypothetical protein
MIRHPDLSGLLFGDPETAEREEIHRHLSDCAECRARLAEQDPSRLFGLLFKTEPPRGRLDELSARIAESVAAETAPGRHRLAAAALAASIALAAALGGVVWRSEVPSGAPENAVQAAAADVASSLESWPVFSAFPTKAVEISSPATAQLLDLSLGDTQLIMIFDEALEL